MLNLQVFCKNLLLQEMFFSFIYWLLRARSNIMMLFLNFILVFWNPRGIILVWFCYVKREREYLWSHYNKTPAIMWPRFVFAPALLKKRISQFSTTTGVFEIHDRSRNPSFPFMTKRDLAVYNWSFFVNFFLDILTNS